MPQPPRAVPPSPYDFPGFWRVDPGMLIEAGDSYLDDGGEAHAFPLERVGQPVKADQVVLRIERRRHPR
jgi:hypothetical protein